ncbi:MAG: redoxin [Methylotenera sp.]|nr:MAG: redoxin [Methylotenera sp.]PPD18237.1 MAG: redoxin [Methylotenera sp.]
MLNQVKTPLFYLALIASFGFAIFYFFLNPQTQLGKESSQGMSTQALFTANFPDENNKPQPLSQYEGKVVVLNFWASWCEPCREEMPELSELNLAYDDKNVVVLGMAIEDVAAINDFLKETKVSYPLFAADVQGMDIAASLGNDKGVLPYTVIIKTDGTVAKTYFGRITKPLLEQTLKTIL